MRRPGFYMNNGVTTHKIQSRETEHHPFVVVQEDYCWAKHVPSSLSGGRNGRIPALGCAVSIVSSSGWDVIFGQRAEISRFFS